MHVCACISDMGVCVLCVTVCVCVCDSVCGRACNTCMQCV